MFRRIFIEEWTTIFTLVAFVTALSVYVTIMYRTLRMRRSQTDRLAQLPFEDEVKPSNPDRHE